MYCLVIECTERHSSADAVGGGLFSIKQGECLVGQHKQTSVGKLTRTKHTIGRQASLCMRIMYELLPLTVKTVKADFRCADPDIV